MDIIRRKAYEEMFETSTNMQKVVYGQKKGGGGGKMAKLRKMI